LRGKVAEPTCVVWSSKFAAYLGTAGAAVGLGSIWRFPYLAGTGGGSAFILVFVIACVLIATPLLAAEFSLGRGSRRSPPYAAGAIAAEAGFSSWWNAIGVLGSIAAFLIFSYYSVVASWVLAYAWKCAAGVLSSAGSQHVAALWRDFRSDPVEVGLWHAAFVILAIVISGRGLRHGVEIANNIRAPGLLVLLLVLVVYSLSVGDVRHGLAFAFTPHFSAINPSIVLAAIGQAFYATGVGQAMMMAYGAYIEPGTSLLRTSLVITGSILVISLLATVMIFPLVFGYGMNPAQGPELVFDVLPRVFTEMPGGRVVGTLFFVLLVLAALMPSIALLEPSVAWLVEHGRWGRMRTVCVVAGSAWMLGLGSVFSFNLWSGWHPLALVPVLADKTVFGVMDYVSSNIMLPMGALLTSVFVGWRLNRAFFFDELAETPPRFRAACIWLLRYLCPLAILAVFIANLL
jgi:neurotransmitter:Na+ symporter, NSS family